MITDQEKFWTGEFGNQYIVRNQDKKLISSSTAMYAKVFARTVNVKSVLELGANIGINLIAIHGLLPSAELSALEINKKAVTALNKLPLKHVYHSSIFNNKVDYQRDFVFTRGVLIHLHPDKLQQAYQSLYNSSQKYICLAEYYSPNPVMIPYHGQDNRLFKRDFTGELLEKYPDLRLVDYGFVYHHDINFPQDDINWFLLEKN